MMEELGYYRERGNPLGWETEREGKKTNYKHTVSQMIQGSDAIKKFNLC